MTYEGHIDQLTSLQDDWTSLEISEALETGADAMAFCQSLWDLFREHGLITDSTTPDVYVMEKVIDSLYGELAAVTLMLSADELAFGPYLDQTIQMFATQPNLLTKANDVGANIPPEVINGFRAFAARLRNASKLKLKAKEESS